MNDACKLKQDGAYIGSLSCGCFEDIVLTIWPDSDQAIVNTKGANGSVNMTSLGDNKFQLYFFRACTLDNGVSDFIDFNVEILPEGLQVKTAWTELNSRDALEACTSLFLP